MKRAARVVPLPTGSTVGLRALRVKIDVVVYPMKNRGVVRCGDDFVLLGGEGRCPSAYGRL